MDLSDFLNSGWESVLVVLGIVGVIINFLARPVKAQKRKIRKRHNLDQICVQCTKQAVRKPLRNQKTQSVTRDIHTK